MKMINMRVFLILSIVVFCFFSGLFIKSVNAREDTFEVRVEYILDQKEVVVLDRKQIFQKLELVGLSGDYMNKKIILEIGEVAMANSPVYKVGDKLIVAVSANEDGSDYYYVVDYVRRMPLYWLFGIFGVVVIAISRFKGIASLISMAISFLVIFTFILPKIMSGSEPVQTVIYASFMIIPVTFYISHGLNRKTTVAIIGTLISLIITGILAAVFVEMAKLSGYSSEEAGFLEIFKNGTINMKGLLLAGIIIGVLGVLDDITISQASIVLELKEANFKIKPQELYIRAMNVGRDHIASMVNTLVLVYTGASLPLLLLFLDSDRSFFEIINYELVADEVVRTMVGSIGLVLAVPITTFIAVLIVCKKNKKYESNKNRGSMV